MSLMRWMYPLALAVLATTALPWVSLPDASWLELGFLHWVEPHAPSLLTLLASSGLAGLPKVSWGLGFWLLLMAVGWMLSLGLARLGAFRADPWVAACVLLISTLILLFVVYPVGLSLQAAWLDEQGAASWSAGWERMFSQRIWSLGCLSGPLHCGVAWNTLGMGLAVGLGTTLLGLALALLGERGSSGRQTWLGPLLRLVAVLPIITPPFVVGLGLILIFGRAGLVNQFLEWAFDLNPGRWFYGAFGLWLAQMFAFTPVAFLLLRGVVQGISPALEEASQTLGATRMQVFRTVTLPLLRSGLANAFLIGFIESMTDFGNPIVVGGSFAVLSTEVFFAIVGAQFDPGRASALAWLLTLFALGVFFLQNKWSGQGNYTTVGGKGDGGLVAPLPRSVRWTAWTLVLPWLLMTVLIYAFAFWGGFVKTWGRDYAFTLNHFLTAFRIESSPFGLAWVGTAWQSLWTTLKLSALAAPLSAILGLLMAWILSRQVFVGRRALEFGTMMAFAIPGTVLGVSYVVAFNVPPLELTGTGAVIVLCFLFRNLPVGVRAGTAALGQIDRSIEESSALLRASTPQTIRWVLLPLLRPAFMAALIYGFVRSMTTVSAVIFLVTAENDLATTYIIGRVGNGDYGVALAYCSVLMLIMLLAAWGIQALVGERELGRRELPH
ncbi:MAG: iron ABC transporter permease [Betaproteobacteria bacterium]|jgi:iron(III) transport system permease protein|nr:iron ABC transporter permease [Betaproteobacteria bacterium]